MEIDKNYFLNYGDAELKGLPYSKCFTEYSGVFDCMDALDKRNIIINSIAILGTATGSLLDNTAWIVDGKHYELWWGIKPEGCEICEWAYQQTPKRLKARVKNENLLDYVPGQLKKGKHYDLIFSNSFIYLTKREIKKILPKVAELGSYLHFQSSFLEKFNPNDPYRKTLESYAWWDSTIREAGYKRVCKFLWKSTR